MEEIQPKITISSEISQFSKDISPGQTINKSIEKGSILSQGNTNTGSTKKRKKYKKKLNKKIKKFKASSSKKKKTRKRADIYVYYEHTFARSKQKVDPISQKNWEKMQECKKIFLSLPEVSSVFH